LRCWGGCLARSSKKSKYISSKSVRNSKFHVCERLFSRIFHGFVLHFLIQNKMLRSFTEWNSEKLYYSAVVDSCEKVAFKFYLKRASVVNKFFVVLWLLPETDILSVQKVLSGSGRAGRLRLTGKYIGHRVVARPELDDTFWTDSTDNITSR